MEFNPTNPIVKRCIQGMAMEEQGKLAQAATLFFQAWEEATNDFEKFLAAHYVARCQQHFSDQLTWFKTALQFALKVNDAATRSALPSLYTHIAKCYEALSDVSNAKKHHDLANAIKGKSSDQGPFYHGTKADLKLGDLLTPGGNSNYQADLKMNHIYFTAIANGAGLAAALAKGDGPERVYAIEPTGSFEDDPNVTDKKFPGNLTRSYRSEAPLKIVGEVTDWVKQTSQDLQAWKDKLANSKGEIIN